MVVVVVGEFFTDLAAKKKKEGGGKKKLKGVDALSAHSTARAQRRTVRELYKAHTHTPPPPLAASHVLF